MSTLGEMIGNFAHSIDQMMESVSSAVFDDPKPAKNPTQVSADGAVQYLDDGSVIAGGVVVPAIVAQQLKRLGMSLESFNPGELEAAIRACAFDSNLIDDAAGVNFMDQLEEDTRERAEDEFDDDDDTLTYRKFAARVNTGRSNNPQGKGMADDEPVSALHETACDKQERLAEARKDSFRSRILRERERRKEIIATAAETGQPVAQELSA